MKTVEYSAIALIMRSMKNMTYLVKKSLLLITSLSLLLISACTSEGPSESDDPTSTTSFLKTEMMAGAEIVRKKCSNCHFLDKKMRKVGPGLAGIYMSKPTSSVLPFDVWDEAALDAWLIDPVGIKANTPMAISGLKDPDVRAQVIAYLKNI